MNSEERRLKNITIFFSALDINKTPARIFFDQWICNAWNKKLGIQQTFCRMMNKKGYS